MRTSSLVLSVICAVTVLFTATDLRAEGSAADVVAWCNIAGGLLNSGNAAGALPWYLRALQYQPANAGIHLAIGRCHQELKQWDRAIACTEAAWAFAGADNNVRRLACLAKGWIQLARADYLKSQGDTSGANYWYNQALGTGNFTKAPGDGDGQAQAIVTRANAGITATTATTTATTATTTTTTSTAGSTTASASTGTSSGTSSSSTASNDTGTGGASSDEELDLGTSDAEDWTGLSSRGIVKRVAATTASARSAEVVLTKAQLYALIKYAKNAGRLAGTAKVVTAAETTSATANF